MKPPLVILCLCVAALAALGVVMLHSTIFAAADAARFKSHLIWLTLGLALVPLLMRLDYHWLERKVMLYVLAVVCLGSLVAVFVPGLGIQTNGANRWLRGLGQPSELAKPVVIILVAAWCARLGREEMRTLKCGFVYPLLLGFVPALLVFLEPDWGTAVLLGATTLGLLFLAGARRSHLACTIVIATVALAVLVACNSIRLERILVFLDPEAHRRGAGWQVWQSLLAIGSGGFWGCFLEGSLHKYGYVPEQQTDFIFARIGEETGLWGTNLTVLLYLGILFSGLRVMQQARDRFGQLLTGGCTIVITLQAWINLAVATSLVPNKGLPLPFVSYGGSSFLAMCLCVGLIASVAWHSRDRSANPPHNLELNLNDMSQVGEVCAPAGQD